ncbi:MAG: ribosome recycling factor, partial [Clostridiales bacterium]|nr:ribosome recycling factor [Clostridiales bacterium]
PTEERRKELVKMARKKAEDSKVAIRSLRRDANEALKKDKKASNITEDDLKELEKDCQDMTDSYIKKIEDLLKEKENEIMEV